MKKHELFKIKKIMSKKSQLRIQEMALMLVGVVLFFALVGMFAMAILYINLHQKADEIAEERTLASITSLADSPEFSCIVSKSNCIDGDKVISLLNKTAYQDFWPFSSLRIVITHTAFKKNINSMVQCTRANYPNCEIITIYDKKVDNERAVSSFVAFCRKEYENLDSYKGYNYDKCEVGMIIAGTRLVPAT
jgi:hypothetical protein